MVNSPIEYKNQAVTPFDGIDNKEAFLEQVVTRESLSMLDLSPPERSEVTVLFK